MKGKDIIKEANESIKKAARSNNPEEIKLTMETVLSASHSSLLEIHSRALACHSECLGMNAENSLAICNGHQVPYSDNSYLAVMKKWGLVDSVGNPII